MPMMATTIMSSMSVKPLRLRSVIMLFSPFGCERVLVPTGRLVTFSVWSA
jgi:hypothetical protein